MAEQQFAHKRLPRYIRSFPFSFELNRLPLASDYEATDPLFAFLYDVQWWISSESWSDVFSVRWEMIRCFYLWCCCNGINVKAQPFWRLVFNSLFIPFSASLYLSLSLLLSFPPYTPYTQSISLIFFLSLSLSLCFLFSLAVCFFPFSDCLFLCLCLSIYLSVCVSLYLITICLALTNMWEYVHKFNESGCEDTFWIKF